MSPRSPAGHARDTPIRQGSLREHNLALVLRHLGQRQVGPPRPAVASAPASRADVAAATGLTRATVSSLVDELLRGRLLVELTPTPRTGVGRPATGLVLASTGPAGLGLEINVDYLAACVVDLTGAVRHRSSLRQDQRGRAPAEVLAALADLATQARAAAAAEELTVAGIAIAVPGLVQGMRVRRAPNLDWRDVDVGPALAAALALPMTLDNEANLAALGEASSGASGDFVYISGEVGIGAGIMLGGELFRGSHGWAGELGHVAVRPDGPPCHCGSRGCLEQYAGQEAILRAARASSLATVIDIAAQAGAGEPRMRAALAEAGRALGVAVAGVVNLLDLGTVVLGGSYATLAPWLTQPLSRELATRVLTAAWSPVTVRASALGPDATVVGAAGSVVRAIREDPAHWLARPP